MSYVYRVSNENGCEYAHSKVAARGIKPGGELPTSVEALEPYEECNRLAAEIDRLEAELRRASRIIRDISDYGLTGDISWAIEEFVKRNPLPPADASDRDGQRSYSG